MDSFLHFLSHFQKEQLSEEEVKQLIEVFAYLSKIIFSEKSLSAPMSVRLSVRPSVRLSVPSCPAPQKSQRNRKFH